MAFDDVGVGVEEEIPHMLEQHGAGHHLPFALHQEFEQAKLARLQDHRPASPEDASGEQIHLEVRNLDVDGWRARLAASDDGGKPRRQFRQGEWLDHVVVGPGIEAGYPIIDAVQGCQEKHGSFCSHRAQPAQDRQSIQPGQHTVDDDHVPCLGSGAGKPAAAIDRDMQIMRELAQALDDIGGGFGIILDQQQAHKAYPGCMAEIVKLLINNLEPHWRRYLVRSISRRHGRPCDVGQTNKTPFEPRFNAPARLRFVAALTALLGVVLASTVRASPITGPSPAPAAIPSRVVADLHLGDAGGSWDYATVDATRGRLLVARMVGVDTVNLATRLAGPVLTSGRHVHSVLPVPDHRLLLTNGDADTATIVDDESGLLLATLKTGAKPDGAVFDQATGQVLVMNGNSGSITRINTGRTPHVAGTIEVGGALEAPALDGSGRLFVNVEDRNEIAVVGLSKGVVVARYKLAGCESPTGLAYVTSHRLLVSVCANGVAEIVGDDGVERARLAVGPHPDAVIADPVHDRVFVPSGGNGTLSEISLTGAPHVTRVFSTRPGARTGAYDPKTQFVYLPYGRMDRSTSTPKLVAGSFGVLVVDTH